MEFRRGGDLHPTSPLSSTFVPSRSQPCMGLMTFKEVAVCFTEEEWVLLDPGQRALYWEVMAENSGMVVSLVQELHPGMNVEAWELAAVYEPRERMERGENETLAVQLESERLSGASLPQAKQTPASESQLEWEDHFLKTAASLRSGAPFPQPFLVSDIRESQAPLKGVVSHCSRDSGEAFEHTLPGLGCETPGGPKYFVKVKEEDLSEEESIGVEMPGRPEGKALRPLGNDNPFLSEQVQKDMVKMPENNLLGNSNGALKSEETFWHGTPKQMRHSRISLEITMGEYFRGPKVEEMPETLQHMGSFQENKPNPALLCGEVAKNVPRRTFPENLLSTEGRKGGRHSGTSLLPEDQARQPEAEKVYNCSNCGKSFSDSLDLVAHERTHIGEKIYKCPHCEKCFSQQTDLQMHKKNHQGEKPPECSERSKGLISSSCLVILKQESGLSLNSFVSSPNSEVYSWTHGKMQLSMEAKTEASLVVPERTHAGENPYSCLDCGKSFNRKSTLVRHKRMHTGEKPYECAECGRRFSIRCNLISHQRIHTGEKPYSCSDCGQSFGRRLQLAIHRKTHTGETPYRCAQCGKCFTRRSSLLVHEKIHKGERPNTCMDCGKTFAQEGYLLLHMRSHTGERTYI